MEFEVLDLGSMSYSECVELQRTLLEEVISEARRNTLLLVEHPPVITLGANFHPENLILSLDELQSKGIGVEQTERGGDVTYHGPGQLIAYPLFHLGVSGQDLHKWLRDLEEVVIRAIAPLGVEGSLFSPHTGVWIGDMKVCAMGIKVRRWVSMHGLALNCDVDLEPFEWIVPCGIQDYGVTSLSETVGRRIGVEDMKAPLIKQFEQVFGLRATRRG